MDFVLPFFFRELRRSPITLGVDMDRNLLYHFGDGNILLLMEEILHHLGCVEYTVNNEINYQRQLVPAGFLNHSQYHGVLAAP